MVVIFEEFRCDDGTTVVVAKKKRLKYSKTSRRSSLNDYN